MTSPWEELAAAQLGMIARRQLTALGVDWHHVDHQVRARRWAVRTPRVISTFTGEPTWRQRVWTGVLHAGGTALIGGPTALEWHGLRNWHRDEITVLVDDQLAFEPVRGMRFFRTRRPLGVLRAQRSAMPLSRLEPATLLFAGYDRSSRTAQGVLAAVVQQRLTTPDALLGELRTMRPLRRSKMFERTLVDIGGGAQSLAELDLGRLCRKAGLPAPARQVGRRDAAGRLRFTDCEWPLDDGRTLVLEIDGAFHMDVEHWEDDLARQRSLAATGRTIIRCTARELREDPASVVRDLRAHGLCT